jgi:site-specific DNA recombinase
VIRTIVARFLAGESLRSLAAWMDDNEIRSVYGKPWRPTTLRDMMISPRIAGLRQHRGEVVGPAVWQPIITQADRARLLALIAQRRITRQRAPRSYLLTELLRCSACNGTLYASRRETTRRYVCMSGPDDRCCGKRTIVAGPLEELITEAVLCVTRLGC